MHWTTNLKENNSPPSCLCAIEPDRAHDRLEMIRHQLRGSGWRMGNKDRVSDGIDIRLGIRTAMRNAGITGRLWQGFSAQLQRAFSRRDREATAIPACHIGRPDRGSVSTPRGHALAVGGDARRPSQADRAGRLISEIGSDLRPLRSAAGRPVRSGRAVRPRGNSPSRRSVTAQNRPLDRPPRQAKPRSRKTRSA